MKQFFNSAMCAVLAFGLVNCSSDDSPTGPDQKPADNIIRLETSINSMSRVTAPDAQGMQAFEMGDKISLYEYVDSKVVKSNIKATLSADGWQYDNKGNALEWINSTSKHKIYGLYPALDATFGSPTSITMDYTQQKNPVDHLMINDYLYVHTQEGIVKSTDPVSLNFKHLLSKLTVNIKAAPGITATAEDIKEALVDAASQGSFTILESGIHVSPDADKAPVCIRYEENPKKGFIKSYSTILIPQQISTFHIKKGDETYTSNFDDPITLTSNSRVIVNITLDFSGVTIGDVTIAPWIEKATEDVGTEDGNLYEVDKSINKVNILYPGGLTADAITEAMNGGDKLAISGPMNGTDFKVLRLYMGGTLKASDFNIGESIVKELDLSGVNVVKGGESYYTDVYNRQCFITEDNSLGPRAFENINYYIPKFSSIRKIILPNTLTDIRELAFYSCGVEEIVLPESLVTISDGAFSYILINTITIPSSVRTIGQTAFGDCKNLKRVEIPEGVENIHSGAFMRNSVLEYVSLPSTLKKLGTNFQECPALKTIEFKVKPTAKVSKFGLSEQNAVNCDLLLNKAWEGNPKLDLQNNTFNGTKFKSITLINEDGSLYGLSIDKTKNLVTILEAGFLHPNAITEAMNGSDKLAISGPMNGTDFKVLRTYMGGPLDANLHSSESKVKELDLSGVNVVKGGEAYYFDDQGFPCYITEDNVLEKNIFILINSNKIKSPIRKITLPKGITRIGEYAFQYVTVNEIILNDGLKKIQRSAFGNSSITKITIPSSVIEIETLIPQHFFIK